VRVVDFRQFRNSSCQFTIFFLKILEPKSACLRLLPFEGALTIDAKAFSMSPFRLLLTNDQNTEVRDEKLQFAMTQEKRGLHFFAQCSVTDLIVALYILIMR
jgi:hypothetical protein